MFLENLWEENVSSHATVQSELPFFSGSGRNEGEGFTFWRGHLPSLRYDSILKESTNITALWELCLCSQNVPKDNTQSNKGMDQGINKSWLSTAHWDGEMTRVWYSLGNARCSVSSSLTNKAVSIFNPLMHPTGIKNHLRKAQCRVSEIPWSKSINLPLRGIEMDARDQRRVCGALQQAETARILHCKGRQG